MPQHESEQQQQQSAAQAESDSQDQLLPVKPWQPNKKPRKSPDPVVTDQTPVSEQSPFSSPIKATSGLLQAEQASDSAQLRSPMSAARHPDGSVHLQTSIVGRRFRTGVTCTTQTPVCLNRQPDNVRDPNAIQVLDSGSKQVLGYLPRDIAQHLASLLDSTSVQVTATVEEPKSIAAVVPIMLQVCMTLLILPISMYTTFCLRRVPFSHSLFAIMSYAACRQLLLNIHCKQLASAIVAAPHLLIKSIPVDQVR